MLDVDCGQPAAIQIMGSDEALGRFLTERRCIHCRLAHLIGQHTLNALVKYSSYLLRRVHFVVLGIYGVVGGAIPVENYNYYLCLFVVFALCYLKEKRNQKRIQYFSEFLVRRKVLESFLLIIHLTQ